jgi:hypothetical protein
MPAYRLYSVNNENHFDGPPALLTCKSDSEAINKASRLNDRADIEVREGGRCVCRIKATSDPA